MTFDTTIAIRHLDTERLPDAGNLMGKTLLVLPRDRSGCIRVTDLHDLLFWSGHVLDDRGAETKSNS